MKKILTVLVILVLGSSAFAGDREDALAFFNRFVNASNSYSTEVPNMYSDNAKIIRQVIKPDSTVVNVPFSIDQYRSQMRVSAKLGKMRGYSNSYSNISVAKVANGYRINALRKPSLSDYNLKSSMVVQKQDDGRWLIVEEMMQTKEQVFLKYAK